MPELDNLQFSVFSRGVNVRRRVLGPGQSLGQIFVVATEGVVGAGQGPLLGQEFSSRPSVTITQSWSREPKSHLRPGDCRLNLDNDLFQIHTNIHLLLKILY